MSHDKFDNQIPYSSRRNDVLTLTGLFNNSTFRLTIVTFDLRYSWSLWPLWRRMCEDYLEVSSIRGYPNNKSKSCGYHNLTGATQNLLPINNKITFTFVTRNTSRSTGFSLKYEGNSMLSCMLHKFTYLLGIMPWKILSRLHTRVALLHSYIGIKQLVHSYPNRLFLVVRYTGCAKSVILVLNSPTWWFAFYEDLVLLIVILVIIIISYSELMLIS